MKKSTAVLVLLAATLLGATPLAFAGGPGSNLPVNTQLHQDAMAIQRATVALQHGAPVAQIKRRVDRIDFALQNVAAQMHITPVKPFVVDANSLFRKRHVTRADLLAALKTDAAFVHRHGG
ncbi:hypothetical protein [Acidithiobacillus ferrooxidans]|uniref:Uncharacterized protein n=1 Tax=Acidithiobacillus ferrooxidans TaxID=920 RepID=A0A2W1KKL3_ACIFR|nr:hypothetical protein [Acidithiobacillus ferrooxidans]MBU2818052.1 hypothetical protein [Acidithiobacillus ferrooxidans]MCR1344006.1 hypothetical protein [Acidithiobacillus ferrooxidans]PZD82384.1 hypothetical protein DN052_05035 [Acidithiobacillus ferrooxidans]QLK41342.1 hypothetical protein FE661_03530 [Acidithiobacillus ferrooxidans]QZT53284.1 hypothetical protein K7B00_03530 [Acidithiobacillus ferrooxidans]